MATGRAGVLGGHDRRGVRRDPEPGAGAGRGGEPVSTKRALCGSSKSPGEGPGAAVPDGGRDPGRPQAAQARLELFGQGGRLGPGSGPGGACPSAAIANGTAVAPAAPWRGAATRWRGCQSWVSSAWAPRRWSCGTGHRLSRHVTAIRQLTRDGTGKDLVHTDGTRVYYSAFTPGGSDSSCRRLSRAATPCRSKLRSADPTSTTSCQPQPAARRGRRPLGRLQIHSGHSRPPGAALAPWGASRLTSPHGPPTGSGSSSPTEGTSSSPGTTGRAHAGS